MGIKETAGILKKNEDHRDGSRQVVRMVHGELTATITEPVTAATDDTTATTGSVATTAY